MSRADRRVFGIAPLPLACLGAAGLAVLAAALWPVDAGAPAAPPAARPPDLAGLAADETGAALTRPPFDPERRAWTARGSREDFTAEERPQTLLSVRGIVIEARSRRALVSDGTEPPTWLAAGESRGSWRLVSIEPTRVVVADSDRHYTLAFLGPPVALRPPRRHPAPEAPIVPPALRANEAPSPITRFVPETALRSTEGTMPLRRIEITRPDAR